MTMREHSDLLNVQAQLQTVLSEAARKRDQRREIEDTEAGPEPGWVVYERGLMLAHVNKIRHDRKLARVYLDWIIRLDDAASGHVDWFEKVTHYYAQLALDRPMRVY